MYATFRTKTSTLKNLNVPILCKNLLLTRVLVKHSSGLNVGYYKTDVIYMEYFSITHESVSEVLVN